jgi:hypothetical protein
VRSGVECSGPRSKEVLQVIIDAVFKMEFHTAKAALKAPACWFALTWARRVLNGIFLPVICLGFLMPMPGWALRPLFYPIALAAGEGTPKFQDGAFTSACFKTPLGMAISEDATRLFVADSGNNRIRVVHLDQANKVTTLAGQDSPGKQDGSLKDARFDQPHAVIYLPGERLVVNDFGNKLLRLVDLKKGTISTLAGNAPAVLAEGPASIISTEGIRDMVYMPEADSLFFTQPSQKTLKRLDLKTNQVSLIHLDPEVLSLPTALCVDGKLLYVADKTSSQVFKLVWQGDNQLGPAVAAAAATNVLALAVSGEYLYALQDFIQAPVQRLLPQNETVLFTTVWGQEIPNPLEGLPGSIARLNFAAPVGFVPDPAEKRKFYIANAYSNTIISFRDLYGNPGLSGSPGLIEPPAIKPPRTFRILVDGDSRAGLVLGYPFPTHTRPDYFNFAKRMELELNTLAALDDIPINFEVMNYSTSATEPIFLWPTYRVPAFVQRRDIDLVIIMEAPSGIHPFEFYYTNPITPEGIPLYPNDMEYLLKPPLERIPEGEPRRFYELCKARHLVKIEGRNFIFDPAVFSTPELRDSLVQMFGKPLDILNRKLSGTKTTAGKPVGLLLCSLHTGLFLSSLEDQTIWADAARRFHFLYLNLNDTMTALGLSFYPKGEEAGNGHLTPDGHLFLSFIMAHSLIREGFIPWSQTSTPQNPAGKGP